MLILCCLGEAPNLAPGARTDQSRRVASAQAQNAYLTGFERGAVAVDGWMGFCDAAAADTGEPHASREAVNVRTGWQTQHMADRARHDAEVRQPRQTLEEPKLANPTQDC